MAESRPDIEPATRADAGSIAGIFAHYVLNSVATFEERPPTAADWRRKLDLLTARSMPFLVAKRHGLVLGFAYATPWRGKPAYRYTVEDTIYLLPQATGHGIGRLLLDALLHKCAEGGMRQVIAVIADTGGGASAALHESLGFRPVGRLAAVGFKHGRWIDTVLMQRDLT